jgi:hypothetical protein
MLRDYSSATTDTVTLFTGIEIEHTVTYGQKTLFVVGIHPVDRLLELANQHECTAVYCGANHSFHPDHQLAEEWRRMLALLLSQGLWVTLDFDVRYTQTVLDMNLGMEPRFVPLVSCKIPHANRLGSNACIKVDDVDFRSSNAGVWVHKLSSLMSDPNFTDWSEYSQDTIIK